MPRDFFDHDLSSSSQHIGKDVHVLALVHLGRAKKHAILQLRVKAAQCQAPDDLLVQQSCISLFRRFVIEPYDEFVEERSRKLKGQLAGEIVRLRKVLKRKLSQSSFPV